MARVHPPDLDVASAAQAAMTQFDTSGDGSISGAEFGLNPALAALDANRDGSVTEEEIAKQLRLWQETRLGLSAISVTVTLRGRPLPGATVTFQPEEFLAESISPAGGVTDENGVTNISIPKEELPNPRLAGARLGVYKVSVSKIENGRELVPAKYNSTTSMGFIVSPSSQPSIRINL